MLNKPCDHATIFTRHARCVGYANTGELDSAKTLWNYKITGCRALVIQKRVSQVSDQCRNYSSQPFKVRQLLPRLLPLLLVKG